MPDVIAAPSAAPTQAESSPAPVNHQSVIDTMTTEQRSKWRMTGELPQAESAPAKESSEVVEATESAPAPEAGQKQEKPQRSNAETRIRELLAENKRLKEAAATRQETKTQAEPSPAPVEKKAESLEAPKKPNIKDFDGPDAWEKYETAKDKYYEDLTDFKKKEAIAEFRQQAEQEARTQRLTKELAEGRKRYEDFDAVAGPALQSILADQQIHPLIKETIGTSPVFVDLLYVLGGNESDMNDFIQTARTDPFAAIRKTVILEGLVKEELAKKTGKETEKPRSENGQFTPEKKVTSAPPPPTEVRATATAPGDAAQEALRKGDFKAYAAEINRREIAARKGN